MILLHGLCSSSRELRLFARTLRDHAFDVITPDIPGYTANGARTGEHVGYEQWVDAVAGAIERANQAHDAVHLCGVSLGATLGLAVASRRGVPVASLSLISTMLFFDGWNVPRWRFLLPLAFHTPLGVLYTYHESPPYGVKNERVRAWIEQQLAQAELTSAGASTIPTTRLREASRLIRHVKRSLGRVDVPVLMIHARDDDLASLANPRFVARRVGSGIVRQTVVDDSYHLITLDNDRDLAALRTVQFFNSVSKRRLSRDAPAARADATHAQRSPQP